MRSDTRLSAFADFKALREGNEKQAVYRIQALLLDEAACALRIRWLREAVTQARADFPGLGPAPRPAFLDRVLGAVQEPGTIAAWMEGRVTFAELEALTRAPRALYEAQCRLLGRDPEPWPDWGGDLAVFPEADTTSGPPPGPPPPAVDVTRPGQPTGLTSMRSLLGRQEYERFRRRLERSPLLPELLAAIELDPGLDRQLLRFMQEQGSPRQPGADAVETMLDWLGAFARSRHARPEVRLSRTRFASIVRRVTARRKLEEARADKPFQLAFRDAALRNLQRDFASARELVQALKAIRVTVAAPEEPAQQAYSLAQVRNIRDALVAAEKCWGLTG
jgi:hypothetical protein